MPQTFRTACVQNCAGPDMAANIAEAERLAIQAATDGADLICLPEFFSCLDVGPERFEVGATDEENHPALPVFTRLARDYHAWILLGSLAVKTASGKISARSSLKRCWSDHGMRCRETELRPPTLRGNAT